MKTGTEFALALGGIAILFGVLPLVVASKAKKEEPKK